MSKYHDIKTADELQAAIREVRGELKRKGKSVENKYDSLRNHYSPSNLVMGFLRRNSDYFNWADMSLHAVRFLKAKVDGRKRN